MPRTPEESHIHDSFPGSRAASAAVGNPRNPQAARPVPSVPAPRSEARPAPGPAAAPGPPRTARIDLVAATDGTAVEAADETVDRLLEDGHAPHEILLVATGEQHPWAQHELTFGEHSYWRQLDEGQDVFCVHASALTRVAARPVVVLAVNGGTDGTAAEALPLALERAGDQLIVCGDPKRLSALL